MIDANLNGGDSPRMGAGMRESLLPLNR